MVRGEGPSNQEAKKPRHQETSEPRRPVGHGTKRPSDQETKRPREPEPQRRTDQETKRPRHQETKRGKGRTGFAPPRADPAPTQRNRSRPKILGWPNVKRNPACWAIFWSCGSRTLSPPATAREGTVKNKRRRNFIMTEENDFPSESPKTSCVSQNVARAKTGAT